MARSGARHTSLRPPVPPCPARVFDRDSTSARAQAQHGVAVAVGRLGHSVLVCIKRGVADAVGRSAATGGARAALVRAAAGNGTGTARQATKEGESSV
uniref:Uncharacterized protein n=1 Tax=Oryza glumipatula TaxID=40148 RepID=A0A0D9ZX25_9ORYZ